MIISVSFSKWFGLFWVLTGFSVSESLVSFQGHISLPVFLSLPHPPCQARYGLWPFSVSFQVAFYFKTLFSNFQYLVWCTPLVSFLDGEGKLLALFFFFFIFAYLFYWPFSFESFLSLSNESLPFYFSISYDIICYVCSFMFLQPSLYEVFYYFI